MRRDRQNGLDYTPLYRFLLSKVGEDFDEVYSEAVARLDRPDPVFHLVARNEAERQDDPGRKPSLALPATDRKAGGARAQRRPLRHSSPRGPPVEMRKPPRAASSGRVSPPLADSGRRADRNGNQGHMDRSPGA